MSKILHLLSCSTEDCRAEVLKGTVRGIWFSDLHTREKERRLISNPVHNSLRTRLPYPSTRYHLTPPFISEIHLSLTREMGLNFFSLSIYFPQRFRIQEPMRVAAAQGVHFFTTRESELCGSVERSVSLSVPPWFTPISICTHF